MESLGIPTLLEDFGVGGVKVRVGMDANAAIGIVQRRGLNNLRHVELDVLWVQEQQARRLLPRRKVPGPLNPSDLMTKHVDQAHIDTQPQPFISRNGVPPTGKKRRWDTAERAAADTHARFL